VKHILAMLLMFIVTTTGRAQEMDTTLRLSVMAGIGWTHYFNNLTIGREGLKGNSLGASFRLMWEPEHRLSIGIESGYYTLYDATLQPGNGHAVSAAIPVFANVRMRILKNFYLTAGTGIAFLRSELTSVSGTSKSQTISYSDAQVSALYLYNLSAQFSVGSELKFLWIDKTDDFVSGLQGVVRWRF
jgi:hypothetical protein